MAAALRRATKRSRPSSSGSSGQLMVPSGWRTSMISRLWRWPISKSALSCAGVIFRAPVPNSISTCSSAMTGISASGNGRLTFLPTCFAKRSSLGFTATAMSPMRVSGRVVEISRNSPGASTNSYFMKKSFEFCGLAITSSSESAVRDTGHQLTMRFPR